MQELLHLLFEKYAGSSTLYIINDYSATKEFLTFSLYKFRHKAFLVLEK